RARPRPTPSGPGTDTRRGGRPLSRPAARRARAALRGRRGRDALRAHVDRLARAPDVLPPLSDRERDRGPRVAAGRLVARLPVLGAPAPLGAAVVARDGHHTPVAFAQLLRRHRHGPHPTASRPRAAAARTPRRAAAGGAAAASGGPNRWPQLSSVRAETSMPRSASRSRTSARERR